MLILILGPQGSGKTTQGRLLEEKLGLTFVSMGEVLREAYVSGDALGQEAQQYWAQGELVPDRLTASILKNYLREHPSEKGYVIDSYPRNAEQYYGSSQVFSEPFSAVIYFELTEDVIMERIAIRQVEENREDETPEALKKRLEWSRTQTRPILDLFVQDGIPVFTIDASPTIEEIHTVVMSKLESLEQL